MEDQPVTKIAALTTTIKSLIAGAKALTDQTVALTTTTTVLTTKVDFINNNNEHNRNNDNNRINPNRGGKPIPIIRVRNNNHTIVMYRKSEHTRESDLKYYEHRYYNKLKGDYYEFKISDSKYRCPFCYNKEYSLTDLLRHASRIASNSHKTVKDIAKHSVLITYIQRYLNVEVNKNKPPDVIDSTILSLNPLLFDVEDTTKLPVKDKTVANPLCDGENMNDETPKEESEEKETEELEDRRLLEDICKDNDVVIHLLVRISDTKVRTKPC